MKSLLLNSRALLVMTIVACSSTLSRGDMPSELLNLLPAAPNAVAVIDAEQLLQSPVAKRESWAATFADAYGSAALSMPPDTVGMVLAADLDLHLVQPRWEVAILNVTAERTAKAIADKLGGVVDTIADRPAVETPSGVYVVELAPQRFGVFAPANRQAVARWIRQPANASSLSPYLAQIAQRTKAAQAAMGVSIDLTNIISERTARGELAASVVMRAHDVSVDKTAKALAGLQGVTLVITAGERLEGTLSIDFDQDVSFLAPVAGPLVLEHFQRLGASMEQWKGWRATASGTSLTMSGELAASDLPKVFGLFRLSKTQPVQVASEPPKPAEPANSSGFNAGADLTRRYFESVANSVAELQKSMSGASPYQFALWVDTCAGRIEMLPTGMVDPEVVKYGSAVSSQLRNLLAALNGLDQQSNAQQHQVAVDRRFTYGYLPTGRTVNYGGYRMRQYVPFGFGQVDTTNVAQQRGQIQQDALTQANRAAEQAFAQIQRDTEATRALIKK
jgi:hypothetical protein